MTASELTEQVVEYIEHYDHVTHGELIQRFGAEMYGDCCISLTENVQICHGISRSLAAVLTKLLNAKKPRIKLHPASALVYLLDGCPRVNIPEVCRPPQGGYKTPHLMFVCFKPAKKSGRFSKREMMYVTEKDSIPDTKRSKSCQNLKGK